MPDRSDSIAAQALQAMRLRRQLETGELTRQEYLARLEGIETTPDLSPAPAPPAAVEITPGPATEPRSKILRAQELLELLHNRKNGIPAPADDSPEFQAESETKEEPVQWRLVSSRTKPELEHIPEQPEPLERKQEPEPESPVTPRSAAVPPIRVARAAVASKPAPEISRSPKPKPDAEDRTRQSRLRKPRMRWVLAVVGGMVVAVGALHPLVVRGFTGAARKTSTVQAAALTVPEVQQPDLILAEAAFVGPAGRRRISGVLENKSGKAYSGVEVTFALIGPNGDTLGVVTATVDRVGSHQTAKFQTTDVKPAAHWVLKSIDTGAQ